ncbi:hypothetical protein [uncultured Parabacteroides sp.]|uniref:hypothetical protein n=1 Tax=uncultured Parabacteroides sp. TaxID=512312 RepID=UPI0025D48418|nr:hypothetical protein [uncultured Parabacteroides sp.]
MADINVLMVGGRRCGKTSVLSSMFYQIINGPANQVFTLADTTDYMIEKRNENTGEMERADVLDYKRMELVNIIDTGGNGQFIVDQNPTNNFWDYVLSVAIANRPNHYLTINFRDAAGEVFEAGNRFYDDAMNYAKSCDVIIIAVDTPYLMSDKSSIVDGANRSSEIGTLLKTWLMKGDKTEKMVLFVPVKCEKWIKEGKIDEVIDKIKTLYEDSIKALLEPQNVKVNIISVETAGGIQFVELRKAYSLYKPGWPAPKKCCLPYEENEAIVILEDGRVHPVESDETVDEDMNATFPGVNIHRPNAWYCIPQGAKYAPKNCEQLPLHILRFLFNKKMNHMSGGVINLLRGFFGCITLQDMKDALRQVGIQIIDQGEGIEVLNME